MKIFLMVRLFSIHLPRQTAAVNTEEETKKKELSIVDHAYTLKKMYAYHIRFHAHKIDI
jgi:hypothetical protein